MSSQVNLHALNTLTAYISAFREIPSSPVELVEFSQSTQDTQELSRKEARRIIRRYKKNLNDYRSGKVVYASRTNSVSYSSSKSQSTSKSKSKCKRKSSRSASQHNSKRKTSSSLPVPSFDFHDVPDVPTFDVVDLPSEKSESGPAVSSPRTLNSPGAGGASPAHRSTSKKKKRTRTRSKESREWEQNQPMTAFAADKEKQTEMVSATAVLTEEGVRDEKQSAMSNLWDTVCSLLAPPDILCYCSGTATDTNKTT